MFDYAAQPFAALAELKLVKRLAWRGWVCVSAHTIHMGCTIYEKFWIQSITCLKWAVKGFQNRGVVSVFSTTHTTFSAENFPSFFWPHVYALRHCGYNIESCILVLEQPLERVQIWFLNRKGLYPLRVSLVWLLVRLFLYSKLQPFLLALETITMGEKGLLFILWYCRLNSVERQTSFGQKRWVVPF